MRFTALILMAVLGATSVRAFEPLEAGQFKVMLDPENLYLPTSIQWVKGDVEIIADKLGLQHSYMSLEFRSKYYREENKLVWANKEPEPRLATDAKFIAKQPVEADGFTGLQVSYESSYAKVDRRLLFHKETAQCRIEYRFQATRDMLVHAADAFTIGIRFAPGFTRKSVCDVRTGDGSVVTADDLKSTTYMFSFLNPGPAVVTDPGKKVSVAISGTITGDLPVPFAPVLLRIKKGQQFGFRIDLECVADSDPGQLVAAKCKAIPAAEKPFALTEVGRILSDRKNAVEAEAVFLKAAELNPAYPTAFNGIAVLRGWDKTGGTLTEGEANAEAAFRNPYNYGIVLVAGFPKGKLTADQQKLWTMDRLICVDNTAFYPDYYLWVARDFDAVNAYAQECAMHRQALWALDRAPYSEKKKETMRKSFSSKITDLEKKLLAKTAGTASSPAQKPAAANVEQERLALFDRLVALENSPLDPNAYSPLIAEFESLKMYTEACALSRQALWALEQSPEPAKVKAAHERLQGKIAEYEKHLIEDLTADLPQLIPIRLKKDAPAGN